MRTEPVEVRGPPFDRLRAPSAARREAAHQPGKRAAAPEAERARRGKEEQRAVRNLDGPGGSPSLGGRMVSRTVRRPVSRCRELQRPSARSARCTAAWASWILF